MKNLLVPIFVMTIFNMIACTSTQPSNSTSPKKEITSTSQVKFTATSMIRGHRVPQAYGSQQANLGVIRQGYGKAEIHVNFSGAKSRILQVADGKWTCSSANSIRTYRTEQDETVVILNENEVYIIPDAVIFGG